MDSSPSRPGGRLRPAGPRRSASERDLAFAAGRRPPLPIFNRQESRRQQVLADDDVERVSDREGGSLGDHTLGDLAATAVDAGLVAPKPRAAPAGARSRARMPQSEPERSRVPRAV